ncbi:alpha/beta fold hydrolase [Phytoactinopolyspora halotolerans]|uniref:Alpha/beta hydrolase n=1 Tax=Phytoactinopolyspora halotolerans TaxID=1981512 RepID=A0A6L9S4I7_9ACTN|nr:alpha/beta hydrolase [Phytoactinopolyspora halotolerans]NEE00056.1 alpha/beta hydrolase [Phytoactinopolyspora halotolerans]
MARTRDPAANRAVDLAYDVAGVGPPVVLIHAGLADRRMWEHQFAALSTRFRVVRYDWRGYGESSDATAEVAHHEDLLALMDTLDIDRATLVGSSYGGAYAVDAALTAPDRVTSLALICPGMSGHTWPPEMGAPIRERVRAAIPADRSQSYQAGTATHVDPDDLEVMAEAQIRYMVVGPDRMPSDLEPRVWEQSMQMCRALFRRQWTSGGPAKVRMTEPPAKGRLAEITTPTLVVNGLADVPYIQQVAHLYVAGIPGAERIDLPDTGHLPPLERPAEVTRLLADFLDPSRTHHHQRLDR